MHALRYVTLDPTPTMWVIFVGVGTVLALRAVETWADRQAAVRTKRALAEVEQEPDTRT